MKFLIYYSILLVLMCSCTVVTSTNIPGKKLKKAPKAIIGTYELELSEDLKLFMGEDYKMSVEFRKSAVVVNDGYNDSELKLNDSVFISKVNKTLYLTMGASPNYSVMKLRKYDQDLYLYPMFLLSETPAGEVASYFERAVDVPGEVDENGEMGFPSVSVTIVDQKLDAFFSSSFCVRDSFRLRRTNSKK